MEVCVKHRGSLYDTPLPRTKTFSSSQTSRFLSLLSPFFVILLLSACSLTGNPGNTSTSTRQLTPSSHGVTPLTTPHSLSKLPDGVGTPSDGSGTPLPTNEVKPLVFNLVYNDAAMEQAVTQIYTPGSSAFHQYLTATQIAQRYALSDTQVTQVRAWLTKNGFTVTSVDALHSSIQVTASVGTIENALHIQLQAHSILGHEFFIQSGEPTLPHAIASLVQSITGLDNFALPDFKPPFMLAHSATTSNADCANYGANNTLTRNKLAAAYQVNQLYQQNIQGQGMTIGVAEFGEPYSPNDIANYAACVGIGTPQIENINVDGNLAAGSGQGEAAMDLELIAGLAPEAHILDYQADTNSVSFAQALVDVFNRVATDHRVQVLSVSYGTGENSFSSTELDAVNRSLRTLAAEGISVFVSSGDCGAYALRLRQPQVAEVSFPASAPYAIAVGGTHLEVNNSDTRISETAWGGDDGLPVCQNDWGSGGGVSQESSFHLPSWQIGPGTTTHYDGSADHVITTAFPPTPVAAPNGLRQVPDVAAAAYPNIAIYYQGSWIASGGTSAAAPIWAAGALLIDQGLHQQGKSPLGGVPELYTLANQAGSHHPYTDITQGNNLFYTATSGWDYVTGWGSPNFQDILLLELKSMAEA
ncbi:MAG TPA: hypothetical protein DHW02_10270 [Ktedonobacter sp.]|nr:hypothetical protein [Ktedonobacter sp.]